MPTVSPAATLCYIVKHPWFVPNWSHHNTLNTNQPHTHPHTHTHTPSLQLTDSYWGGRTSSMRAMKLQNPHAGQNKTSYHERTIHSFFSRRYEALQQSHKSLPLANALHIHTRPNAPPSHRHAPKTHATSTYLLNNVQTDVPTEKALAVSRSFRSYSMQFLAHACRWEYLPLQQQLFSARGKSKSFG